MNFTILTKKLIITIIPFVTILLGCMNQSINVGTPLSPSATIITLPTLTHTQLPTITITPLPTLEITQSKELLRQLLVKQEICQNPCFWYIEPEQTTLEEAQSIFKRLNLPLTKTLERGNYNFYATSFGFESGMSVSIVLVEQNTIVASIKTSIGLANYKESSSTREWLAFSPETVISQYGKPTHVEFNIGQIPSDGSTNKTIFYILTMYFDSYNLIVEYNSKLVENEKSIKVCPLIDEYDGVVLWLGKNTDHSPQRLSVSLENSTTLSLNQFQDLMIQQSEKACFDLSRDSVLSPP